MSANEVIHTHEYTGGNAYVCLSIVRLTWNKKQIHKYLKVLFSYFDGIIDFHYQIWWQ